MASPDVSSPGVSGPKGPSDDSPRTLDDPQVIQRIHEYRAALEAGEHPDYHGLLAEFPEIADELAACLDALAFVHQVVPQLRDQANGVAADKPERPDVRPVGALGDFHILREIGRGGMGVVYEAEQGSLGRRVALKVLPFAAVLDQRQLARFKNEAQAAAQLHHQNIVPVHAVGCERGVHYYAMQFIEGHTLAEVIDQLRELSGVATPEGQAKGRQSQDGPSEGAQRPAGAGSELASELARGRFAPPEPRQGDAERTTPYRPEQERGPATATPAPDMAETPAADKPTQPIAALSTERSVKSREFFRTVAGLGVQAAEALDYAHTHGVLHRDVKPGNLILDAEGKLWITDFGLAHMETDASLTLSGDIVGTVRYMSPEQALAKRVVVDHRTDIYSLGVTLYELLTLQPAFPGRDRQELLRQIAFEEPKPPRKLNRAIPAELETIVTKAIAKNPAERYTTAQELADDLERFLDDKPIQARRPTLVQRVTKWSRRHKPLVASAMVSAVMLVVLTVAGLAVANVLIARERDQKDDALNAKDAALVQKQHALEESKASEAKALTEAATTNAVLDLVKEMFMSASPYASGRPDYPVRQLLDDFSEGLGDRLKEEPEVEATIRHLIGKAYAHLWQNERAAPHLKAAIDLYRRELGNEHPKLAECLVDYGFRVAKSADPTREALAIYRKLNNPTGTMRALAALHHELSYRQRRGEEADRVFEEAEALALRFPDGPPPEYAFIVHVQGESKRNRGDLEEAAALGHDAVELHRKLHPQDHPDKGWGLYQLAQTLRAQGDLPAAEQYYREALGVFRGCFGKQGPGVRVTLSNLVSVLEAQGKNAIEELGSIDTDDASALPSIRALFEEAESTHLRIAELEEQLAEDPADPAGPARELARSRLGLGDLLKLLGQDQAAAESWRQALDGFPYPVVEYKVRISTPGTYRLHVRADGPNAGSDSLYARVAELSDGPGGSADWYYLDPVPDADFATKPWVDSGGFEEGSSSPALWTITEAQDYTVQFMMREDGVALDAFVLQLASLPAPVGEGPPESERTDDMVFLESGGRVVAEAEHFSSRRAGAVGRNWLLIPDHHAGDSLHRNFRASGYLQALPDMNKSGYFLQRHPLLLEEQTLAWDLERYIHMIAAEPDSPDSYRARADLYLRLNEHRNAIADFSRAIELTPDKPEWAERRGELYAARALARRAPASVGPEVLDCFDSGQIANTTAWQRVSDTRTAPAGTRLVRVRLLSTRSAGGNNDGYFDDLSFHDGSGANLLENPGYEEPLTAGEIPGWAAGGNWQQRTADPTPHGGKAYFFAGAGPFAELRQDVDLSAYAAAIDAGKQEFTFEGYVRSYDQGAPDTSRIVLEYRSARSDPDAGKIAADCLKAIELGADDAARRSYVAWLRLHGDAEKAYEDVIQLFEGLAAKSPEVPAYARQLAQTHIDFGKFHQSCEQPAAQGQQDKAEASFQRAIQVLAAAVEANPDDVETHKLRARFHEGRKEYAQVIEACSRLIELTPTDAEWWCKRGWVRGLQGDWKSALPDLSKAIDLNPHDGNRWNVRAIAYGRLGQFDKAFEDYAKALDVKPSSTVIRSNRAGAYRKAGLWDKAIEDYSRLIELEGKKPDHWYNRGKAYQALGKQEQAEADFDQYVALLSKPVEDNPNDWSAWNRRGVVHSNLQRWEDAITDFSKAIELKPDEKLPWSNRAVCHGRQRHWEKAAADYTKAVGLEPDNVTTRYSCALTRLAAGEIDAYRKACAELVERFAETDDLNAAQFAAWTCVLAPDAVTDFARPVQLAEKVVEKNPGDPSYLDTLGGVLYRAGRLEEAIQRLTEAERLAAEANGTAKSSPAYTWLFLAMAHQRTGNDEEAKKWFNKAVDYTDKVLAEEKQPGASPLTWNRRLTLELLRTEAAKLLAVTQSPIPNPKSPKPEP